MTEYLKEVTLLTPYDCFIYFAREKTDFDFPIHQHEELELNLILNGKGVQRIVGDHMSEIGDAELVLVGSNIPHAWFTHKYIHNTERPKILEITIQFHPDLLDDKFLQRNQLYYIKDLLQKAQCGLSFGAETIEKIKDKIISLNNKEGFYSVIGLFTILQELSESRDISILCQKGFTGIAYSQNDDRLDSVLRYMQENFQNDISHEDISKVARMTGVSFSRFIKKKTGKTFVDVLLDIRIGHATRQLIEGHSTVSEIAFNCGFKNLSYFNRVFKSKKNKTPLEFRNDFHAFGKKTIV